MFIYCISILRTSTQKGDLKMDRIYFEQIVSPENLATFWIFGMLLAVPVIFGLMLREGMNDRPKLFRMVCIVIFGFLLGPLTIAFVLGLLRKQSTA